MHKPLLTPAITRGRCEYLYGQWRRGHLDNIKDIKPKIIDALPARPNEIDDLYDEFIRFLRDESDVWACERCGCLTNECVNDFGDMEVCCDCLDILNEEGDYDDTDS